MPWTKLEYITSTRAVADATGAARWGTAAGSVEVLDALDWAHASEWKRLLNENRFIWMSERSLTTDSSGRITVAALDSPNPLTGNTQERFYRILALLGDSGATPYKKASFDQIPTAVAAGSAAGLNTSRLYYRAGTYIQILPKTASLALTAWVNHIPTRPSDLSTDGTAVEFPEDYELIVAYSAAAILCMKGGAEVEAAASLQTVAEQMRQSMLGDLGREDTEPVFMRPTDLRDEWAG